MTMNEAERCKRAAEMVQKRHRDHEDVCLWCGKPWPCVDYVDSTWALTGAIPPGAVGHGVDYETRREAVTVLEASLGRSQAVVEFLVRDHPK